MTYVEAQFYSDNSAGSHRLVYHDWGDKNANPVLCLHGLIGNSSDFDYLAEDLIKHGHRLICVDLAGRGRSDFLSDPHDYNYRQYLKDIDGLLEHLGYTEESCIDFLGVSMGGLIGMHISSRPNSPIKRFIINDVGPEVPHEMIAYIHKILVRRNAFDNLEALEERLRATRGLTWGVLSDEQWAHMAKHNARRLDNGSLTYTYDPRISVAFKDEPTGHKDLWPLWEDISCPVMLIHGERSLVLTEEIINKMRSSGPAFDLHVCKDCGHVPSLWAPEHIEAIRTWLNKV